LQKGPSQFKDEYQGQEIEVHYDAQNQTARILDSNGNELPTLMAFWFAWYAFHPETDIHTTD